MHFGKGMKSFDFLCNVKILISIRLSSIGQIELFKNYSYSMNKKKKT